MSLPSASHAHVLALCSGQHIVGTELGNGLHPPSCCSTVESPFLIWMNEWIQLCSFHHSLWGRMYISVQGWILVLPHKYACFISREILGICAACLNGHLSEVNLVKKCSFLTLPLTLFMDELLVCVWNIWCPFTLYAWHTGWCVTLEIIGCL
jgi:hypothetical protein